jgi:hypothetical protein
MPKHGFAPCKGAKWDGTKDAWKLPDGSFKTREQVKAEWLTARGIVPKAGKPAETKAPAPTAAPDSVRPKAIPAKVKPPKKTVVSPPQDGGSSPAPVLPRVRSWSDKVMAMDWFGGG